jgi:type II secretory pathway pseudopilin PulG
MVVVAIVGILAGLAIPNFTRNWEDERLNSATKLLAGWLEDVRRQAIQRSEPCRNSCGIFANLNLKQEVTNSSQLQFQAMANTPNTVVFTPRGTVWTNPADNVPQLEWRLRLGNGGSGLGRCLKLMTPLGLIRTGKERNGQCLYATAF